MHHTSGLYTGSVCGIHWRWVDKAPDFELPDQEGQLWRLTEHLQERPTLVVFYRGDW